MTRIRTIMLLGPPTADTIAIHPLGLISHILPAFDDPVRIEDHIGTGPLPTLSTFDPDESSHLELLQQQSRSNDTNDDNDNDSSSSSSRIQQQSVKCKRKSNSSIEDRNKSRKIQEKTEVKGKKKKKDGEENEESDEEILRSWRVLQWTKPALHTGFTQISYLSADELHDYTQHVAAPSSLQFGRASESFLDMTSMDVGEPFLPSSQFAEGNKGEDPYAYLENSYAAHIVPTSQISAYSACDDEVGDRLINDDEEEEGEDSLLDDSALPGFTALRPPLPHIPLGILTNLRDMPTALGLERLRKTWTVNLLVGIASMPQPRMLKTRSHFRDPERTDQAEINTLVVGDETSAGFEVNVWLSTAGSAGNANHHNNNTNKAQLPSLPTDADPNAMTGMSKVKALRVGDIVLLQNIALSSYKGQVFGNTLRRDRSKITLIYRDEKGKRADLSASDDQQVLKVRMVREWVRECVYNPYVDGRSVTVGGGDCGGATKKRKVGGSMPDDTQVRESWIEDSF